MLATRLPRSLIRLRAERRWSQGKLAEISGVSRSTISHLESGSAADLSVETLKRLSFALGVGFDYLLLGGELLDPKQDPGRKLLFWVKQGICTSCQLPSREPHALPDCIVSLDGAGRSRLYVSHRFGLTLRSVEVILEDEYEIKRVLAYK